MDDGVVDVACTIPGVGALLRSFYAVRSKELEVKSLIDVPQSGGLGGRI